MSWFSNAWDKIKEVGGKVANVASKVATVALPVAGFAVGLVAPSLGAAIGKVADKIGNKLSDLTGIGDGKPGILGIGDGLPGVLGIGTGKNAAEKEAEKAAEQQRIADLAVEKLTPLLSKANTPAGLTAPEKLELAKLQAQADMKSEGMGGIIPWLIGGLGLILLA